MLIVCEVGPADDGSTGKHVTDQNQPNLHLYAKKQLTESPVCACTLQRCFYIKSNLYMLAYIAVLPKLSPDCVHREGQAGDVALTAFGMK